MCFTVYHTVPEDQLGKEVEDGSKVKVPEKPGNVYYSILSFFAPNLEQLVVDASHENDNHQGAVEVAGNET